MSFEESYGFCGVGTIRNCIPSVDDRKQRKKHRNSGGWNVVCEEEEEGQSDCSMEFVRESRM